MAYQKPRLITEATIQIKGEQVRVIIQTHLSRLGTDIYTAWSEKCDRLFFKFGEEPKPWIEADLIRSPVNPLTIERFRQKWAHINSL